MKKTRATLSNSHGEPGFSLLELIAVLMVMAIMATLMAPSLIKQMKQAAAEQESADLQRLAQGLKDHIVRNKQIPDETDWAEVIATELGLHVGEVSANSRHASRVYLIDPAFQIGSAEGRLPYTQTNRGSVVEPIAGAVSYTLRNDTGTSGGSLVEAANSSWRLMILSSLDPAKPVPVSSGVIGATSFDNIWNAADGEVPAGWGGHWLNHGEDLKIQRINLASLFKRLILNNYDAPASGVFSMDDSAPSSIPSEGINAFFIEGTVVNLFGRNQSLESRQMLRWPATFVYERGNWRGQMFQGLKLTDNDLYPASTLFLKSQLNAHAEAGATPAAVVEAMTGYFAHYANWAAAGFPGLGTATRNAVQAAQATLKNVSKSLIAKPAP